MMLRSQPWPRASEWTSLPAEIRLMILSIIASQKFPGWASLASVCKEWQSVLEKVNLYKIRLPVSHLDGLENILSQQKREFIHHLCLDVVLPPYTSTCCAKRRSLGVRAGPIVSDGIWKLFSILSTWRLENNLALEINVYSPSDCEHWFKNIYLSSDNVEHDRNATPDPWKGGNPYHDENHGWINGQRVEAPPKSALVRLFRPIRVEFGEDLPRDKAVTRLIIRRQLRRCISPAGLGQILSSLDRLEDFSYEPWASCEHASRELYNRGIAFQLQENLPPTLKRLTVFEDSYEFYDPFAKSPANEPPTRLDFGCRLDAFFASKSLELQHLGISFMTHAEDLFLHCKSEWIWQHLQSLALTSNFLQEDWQKRERIESLLCLAGALARRMPLLKTFLLWNGGKGHACAFIYQIETDSAAVTWRGTWQLDLSPAVVESWQLVAPKLPVPKLQIRQESVRAVINSHGDAIHHLELPCQVVEPASLWQIRREAACMAENS